MTWNAVNTGLPTADVTALAIDPLAPSIVYAGTNGSGVFRSTNGGASWGPLNAGLTNLNVSALATPRSYQPQVYVGTGSFPAPGAGGGGDPPERASTRGAFAMIFDTCATAAQLRRATGGSNLPLTN